MSMPNMLTGDMLKPQADCSAKVRGLQQKIISAQPLSLDITEKPMNRTRIFVSGFNM
jgi:hypothetical protein